jgi:subtilisin family serine protease
MLATAVSLNISLAQPLTLEEDTPGGPLYVGSQVIVHFRGAAADSALADVLQRGRLKVHRHFQTEEMKRARQPGITVAWSGGSVRETIARLRGHPAVEFVEPNWVYTHQATSNDPYFTGGSLWGMAGDQSTPSNVYGSQAAEAWAAGYTGSRSVVVGVIDQGMQDTHPDLAPNIWTNPYDPVDGLDNDGNGFANDTHGWNFVGDSNQVYTSGEDSHGTHVAGTIGAVGGNGAGVAGVNWLVTIISTKFLGPNGGTTADAIAAVDYYTGLKRKHPEMDIVALNNSWGGGGYSQALHDAILRAAKAGILFVAAAGNGDAAGKAVNNDTTPFYPAGYSTAVGTTTESSAGYEAVIAVTAISSTGTQPAWANYGAKSVDLGAPGASIVSTVPTGTYASYNGTSMATPHVTGAAALYASTHPTASALDIRNAILGSVTATTSLAGRTVTGGRLDIGRLMSAVVPPPTPPAAPTGVSATAGDARVTVAWSSVAGATGYNVKRSTTSGGPYSTIVAGSAATSYVDTSLGNGTTYYYVVSAANTGGESPNSAQVSATPVSPLPAAPSGLTATVVSKTRINLAWVDNANNETGFKIERSTNGTSYSQIATVSANVKTYSSTGLKANTKYYYRVRAYNTAGNSAYSSVVSATTTK